MVAVPLLALINLAWVPAPMLICNIGLSTVIMTRGRHTLERAEVPPLILGLALGTFAGAAILALVEGRRLVLLPGVALGYLGGRAVGGRMSPAAVRYAMLTLAGTAGIVLLLRSL
jgi:hypothetical protein